MMNRRWRTPITAVTAGLGLFLGTAGTASAASSGPTNWGAKCIYTVAAGPLNVRSAPSTGASIIDSLGAGGQIMAYQGNTKNADGYTWRMITAIAYKWGTGEGWVATNFLSGPDSCDSPPIPDGTVAASPSLNVRTASGPGSAGTGSVIGTVPNGATVYFGCTAQGPSVTGPWGASATWDALFGYRTSDGAYHSLGGWAFVADAWVDTGGDSSNAVVGCS